MTSNTTYTCDRCGKISDYPLAEVCVYNVNPETYPDFELCRECVEWMYEDIDVDQNGYYSQLSIDDFFKD